MPLTTPWDLAQAVERLYEAAGCPTVSADAGFADVDANASYAEAVAWAKSQGVVKGMNASAFQPDAVISQAQFAAMLTRYAALQGKAGASANANLAQGLTFAKSNGLLTGSAVTASTADYALTKLGK